MTRPYAVLVAVLAAAFVFWLVAHVSVLLGVVAGLVVFLAFFRRW